MNPHTDTHMSLSHSPGHPHTHLLAHFVFCYSYTLLLTVCSMSMLMCWQWFILQSEAVLLNLITPGTEKIPSKALTAVMLHTATLIPPHPVAHPLCSSLPLCCHFPNLYSLSTTLSYFIHSLAVFFLNPSSTYFSLICVSHRRLYLFEGNAEIMWKSTKYKRQIDI